MPISRIVSNAAKKVSSFDHSAAAADRRFDRRRERRRRILFRLEVSMVPEAVPMRHFRRDTSQPPNAFHKDIEQIDESPVAGGT